MAVFSGAVALLRCLKQRGLTKEHRAMLVRPCLGRRV